MSAKLEQIVTLTNCQYDECGELRKHLIEARDLVDSIDGHYYAKRLDDLEVPWNIQNQISVSVSDPRNDAVQLYRILGLDVIHG
ncbi:hypothetical protein [Vibrio harveyi]|uniref:hypothetical protein n=1 Tax=Vibrio harveyi TaxID=669 RepID=UPI0025B02021|nr:hypothetical protein [Vibrio harveyi]WJT11060.1 hypothetical protein PH545_28370 [Vibrio harveyi]